MPGFVLDQSATVLCLHGGQAQPVATNPRVKAGGAPVATQPGPYVVSGCSLPTNAGGPCVSAQWVTGALRVRAGGQPLLLQDSVAVCAPTGTGLNVVLTQVRVRAS